MDQPAAIMKTVSREREREREPVCNTCSSMFPLTKGLGDLPVIPLLETRAAPRWC